MIIDDELYDNLLDAIHNFESLIRINVFNREQNNTLHIFGKEFFSLCKSKNLNLNLSDVTNLPSYNNLLDEAGNSRSYIIKQFERFFEEWIIPSKIEIYGY
ncbi:TPA: hypothetical protein ACGPDF_001473 [Streptococcus suis]